jgi:hypothetical protein
MVLTNAARVVEEARWNPILIAAFTIRTFRQVRCGSSELEGVELGFMMVDVDVEDLLCPE